MPQDPFYGPQTPEGKLRKQLIAIWPPIYQVINHLFSAFAAGLKEMVMSVYQAMRG
jgi:hypothetical protein